jgi:hypothetical protein
MKRRREEPYRRSNNPDTQQRRQQSRPELRWWNPSMENFDMASLRIESTSGVRDARLVASRRNAIWRRSPATTMDCAERSALAS